ncbi:MAG: hypothetical protein ACRERV_16295 [Methylococcales bacterium]
MTRKTNVCSRWLELLANKVIYWGYQSLALAATCNNNIPESTQAAAFNLGATDGTVAHNPTGLVWSRCALGQTWNQATLACVR